MSPQPLIQYVNHLSTEINKDQRESPHRHVDGSTRTPKELEGSRRWQLMEEDRGPGAGRKRLLSFPSRLLSDGVLSLCSALVTTVGIYQVGPVQITGCTKKVQQVARKRISGGTHSLALVCTHTHTGMCQEASTVHSYFIVYDGCVPHQCGMLGYR